MKSDFEISNISVDGIKIRLVHKFSHEQIEEYARTAELQVRQFKEGRKNLPQAVAVSAALIFDIQKIDELEKEIADLREQASLNIEVKNENILLQGKVEKLNLEIKKLKEKISNLKSEGMNTCDEQINSDDKYIDLFANQISFDQLDFKDEKSGCECLSPQDSKNEDNFSHSSSLKLKKSKKGRTALGRNPILDIDFDAPSKGILPGFNNKKTKINMTSSPSFKPLPVFPAVSEDIDDIQHRQLTYLPIIMKQEGGS